MADSASDLPRLSVLTGSLAGKELVLEEVVDNILIGADPSCRFHIPLPGISPIHARIWMDAAGVTVYDTHSPRGLYVNDDRVSGQAPLRNGDILWLGTPGEEEAVMIQCRLPQRAAAAPEPPAPAPAPVVAAPVADTDSTVVMGAPLAAREPEALEVVEEAPAPALAPPAAELPNDLEAIEDSPADATLVMAAHDVPLEEPPTDATLVMAAEPALEAAPEPDSDATIVGDANAFYIQDETVSHEALPPVPPPAAEPREEPVQFAVDAPPLPTPPVEPVSFEDETQESPTVIQAAPEAEPEPVVAPPPPPPPPVRAPAPAPAPVAAPAPKPARVSAPAPAPAPRPAVAPAPPAAASARGGSGARNAMLGIAGLVVVGGAFAAWRYLQAPSTPAATPATTLAAVTPATPATEPPATQPAAEPTAPPETTAPEPVEEVVTIVKSPPPTVAGAPTPAPAAKPTPTPRAPVNAAPAPPPVSAEALRAQQTAAQVTTLLGQAEAASAARNYDGAAGFYEEVLKLDPQNPRATEGRSTAQNAAFSLRRSFVAGKTTVKSEKAAKGPAGFDTEDVSVAKGLDYSGRIDFEASPRNVKPGDSYNVLVYLTNDGKKSFKVGTVSVTTTVNGAKSGGATPSKARELEPQQRVLMTELPGTWQASTTGWSLEVVVSSARGDTLRNVLTWK